MSASPHGRCADRGFRRLVVAVALLTTSIGLASACEDDPVVEPESTPIEPKVDKLKKNVESFDEKVEETIEKQSADVGVSVGDATD